MSGFDPRKPFESAWWAVEVATERAENAEAAAAHAAQAAARQERLASSGSSAAEVHARLARAHRASERRLRAAAGLQRDYAWLMAGWVARHDPDSLARPVFMNAVARTVGWRDAVLSVRDHHGAEQLVAASDETARRAHELEMILGEGPSWDGGLGRCILVAGDGLKDRWPRYASAVASLDVHAVAAEPVHLGSDLLGALTLTDADEGANSSSNLTDIVAALRQCLLSAPELLQALQPEVPTFDPFEDADVQPELHQAAGVLRERTGLPVDDAIDLIRAHAYAEDCSVADVAAEVLNGSLLGL